MKITTITIEENLLKRLDDRIGRSSRSAWISQAIKNRLDSDDE